MRTATIESTRHSSDRMKLMNLPAFGVVSIESHDYHGTVDMHLTTAEAENLIGWLQEAVAEQKDMNTVPAPKPQGFSALTPLAQKVVQHIRRAGSISAREAMNDYGISSASLARRIKDIEEAGFGVVRDRRVHPITHQRYTRYELAA